MARVESTPLLWSSDHSLPGNSVGTDESSSIIQTSDGTMWAVWEKEVWDGHAIFYSTSSDYGLTWASAKNLTHVPNFDLNTDPSVIQLSNGTIIVAWSSRRPPPTPPPTVGFDIKADPSYLSIRTGSSENTTITVTSLNNFDETVELSYTVFDGGEVNVTASFNPTQVTPPPNGTANSTMTITVRANATLQEYFMQVKGTCPLLGLVDVTPVTVKATKAQGLSLSSTSSVSISDSISPDANEKYVLYYRTSNDLGATWSKEKLVPLTSNVGDNLSPSIMQAANGTIWLAWTSTRVDPSNTETFYKTTNGITWSNDFRLTYNASTDSAPAITQMQDGRIWVAWESNRYAGSFEEIVYNIYDGDEWLGEQRLTNNMLADTTPAILQSQDGVIRIFWSSNDMSLEGDSDIYYVESANNGASWSSPIEFPADTPTSTYEDLYPSVTQSIDSRIWVMRTTNVTGNLDLYFKTSLIHNVAVKAIVPSQVRVYQEEIVPVSVTIENQGDYYESSIQVTLYANTTFIGSQIVSLNSRASTKLSFNWDTSGFVRGNYTMKAEANAVAGEVYIGDNVRTEGDIAVKLLGDVDDNRLVEVRDLWAVGKAYGSIPGNPSWNEEADLNGDHAVNRTDVSSLSSNYGNSG